MTIVVRSVYLFVKNGKIFKPFWNSLPFAWLKEWEGGDLRGFGMQIADHIREFLFPAQSRSRISRWGRQQITVSIQIIRLHDSSLPESSNLTGNRGHLEIIECFQIRATWRREHFDYERASVSALDF